MKARVGIGQDPEIFRYYQKPRFWIQIQNILKWDPKPAITYPKAWILWLDWVLADFFGVILLNVNELKIGKPISSGNNHTSGWIAFII